MRLSHLYDQNNAYDGHNSDDGSDDCVEGDGGDS